MIIEIKISIKLSNKNVGWYKKLGYDCKSGDIIEINTKELPIGSKQKVQVKCSFCGIIKSVSYCDYNKVTMNDTTKYFCKKCKNEKAKATNLEKYGVENVFQLKSVKEKIKETCLEKYGTEHHLQNGEILEKQQLTNQKKHGVNFIPQLKKHTNKSYIKKAKLKHGSLYKYNHLNYISMEEKVIITCNIHGDFSQNAKEHLRGSGCPICGMEKFTSSRLLTTKEFIDKSIIKHSNKYDYTLTKYVNSSSKVIIRCIVHGNFEQIANDHLNGCGCPKCNISKGENYIMNFLDEHNIEYIHQMKFSDCKYKSPLPFDFYLSEYNMCIEYDGEQHFKSIEYWGGEKGLENRKRNDNIKNKYCEDNNIKLLRIAYNEDINEKLRLV